MENNVSHSGIKGMKWGIRRYQNKDGSLTPEGKKRYNESPDGTRTKKRVKDMSDEELSRVLKRARMESEYKQLKRDSIDAGAKFADTLGNKIVKEAMVKGTEKSLERLISKSLNFGIDTILASKGIKLP